MKTFDEICEEKAEKNPFSPFVIIPAHMMKKGMFISLGGAMMLEKVDNTPSMSTFTFTTAQLPGDMVPMVSLLRILATRKEFIAIAKVLQRKKSAEKSIRSFRCSRSDPLKTYNPVVLRRVFGKAYSENKSVIHMMVDYYTLYPNQEGTHYYEILRTSI